MKTFILILSVSLLNSLQKIHEYETILCQITVKVALAKKSLLEQDLFEKQTCWLVF
jgi:hypothetical protein